MQYFFKYSEENSISSFPMFYPINEKELEDMVELSKDSIYFEDESGKLQKVY